MKKLIAIGFGACVSMAAGAAYSADLPARVQMPVKAPILAPIYNWSGFYIGGHFGGVWSDDTATLATTTPFATAGTSTSPNPSGVLGGGQIGFNYQVGQVVFGVQFDGSWTNDKDSSSVPVLGGVTARFSENTDWFSTLTGRIGYAWDSMLLYVKGGGAWSRVSYTTDGLLGGAVIGTGSVSDTRDGWTVGGGIEYGFAPNWSAFAEYDYLDFGTNRYNFPIAAPGVALSVPTDVQSRVNIFKAGLNYRLNWFGPVVARY